MKQLFSCFILILVFFSCVHEPTLVGEPVKTLFYVNDTLNVAAGTTAKSESPIFKSQTDYSFEIINIEDFGSKVSVDETGIIHVSNDLAAGEYNVDLKITNANGESVFLDVFTIIVLASKITFDEHIKPLIIQNCSSCHTLGASAYTKYPIAKVLINEILRRIQLEEPDGDFMPLNRPALSKEKIDLIIQWKTDGLLEKK